MGKRPVDVIYFTGTDDVIDLISDSNKCVVDTEPLRRVKPKIEIPWITNLPPPDPFKKYNVARRLSVRDQINIRELRKNAAWFDESELRFKAAMEP